MSWIGGSLSNLTGQLSNLTKDILTEGTEEISDHATELRIAQEKITECQTVITAQKNESVRLKQIIHELEEKAESSELQINSISAQYRGVLEEKEKEINELKQSQQEAFQHQQLSASSDYGSHTGQAHSSTGYHGSFVSDDLDFGDNIGMQHEINRLTQEAQRLRSECQHWKSVAQSNNAEKQGQQNLNGTTSDVLELKNQLKELEGQLRHGKEQQQQEVACMQDVHKQKLNDLRKKFKAEVTQKEETILDLQKQLQSYESSITDKPVSPEGLPQDAASLKTQVENLEKEKVDYLVQIERLTSQVKQLGNDLESSQTSREKDVAQLKKTLQDRDTEIAALRKEYEKVCSSLHSTKYHLLDQLDANHAQALELLGDLQEVRRVIGSEARTHRQRVAKEKQELVNQIIQSGNKQRNLKDCVAVLQEEQEAVTTETNEILTDLGNTEHQKLTAGIIDSMEQENLILKKKAIEHQEQITLLEKALQTVSVERQRSDSGVQSASDQDQLSVTSEMSELSQRNKQLDEQVALLQKQIHQYELDIEQFEVVKSDWQSEKEALEDVLMDLREELRDKENTLNILQAQKGLAEAERRGRRAEEQEKTEAEAQGQDRLSEEESTAKSDELTAMEKMLADKDDQIAEMTIEKESLEAHINEMTLQHQQQIKEAVLVSQQELNTSVDQVSHLQQDIQQLQQDKSALEKSLAETEKTRDSENAIQEQLDVSLCEVSRLKTELQEKEGQLSEAHAEKTELETGLEELDAQNQEAMDQLIRIRDDLVKQLEQARIQGNSAVEETKTLTQQLAETQRKLKESETKSQSLQQQLDSVKGQSEVKGESSSSEEVENLTQAKDDLIELVKEAQSQVQEKEEMVQKLEEQLEEAQWLTQEKEDQISNLQQQLMSLREWEGMDDQADVSDTELSDIKDKNLTLESDVKRLKQSLTELEQACDKKDNEIKDMKQKLQSGALAVNDLHMDIKDLEDRLKKSDKTISEKSEAIKALRLTKVELQTKNSDLEVRLYSLQQSYESLQKESGGNSESDSLRERLRATDEEISSLKLNIEKYKQKQEESTTEKESLELHIKELTTKVEESSKLNSDLKQQLSKDKEYFETELSQSSDNIAKFEQKIDALQSEKEAQEKDFKITQQTYEGKIKDWEEYVKELKKEQELGSTSQDSERQRLIEACHVKDVEVTELQSKVEYLKGEAENLREQMESALVSHKQLSDLLKEKENNITAIGQEKSQLEEEQEASIAKIREQELMLKNLQSLEESLHTLQEENGGLRTALEDLKHSKDNSTDSSTIDVVTDLESELTSTKQRIAELELEIAEYQSQVKVTSFVENESAFSREQEKQLEEELAILRQTVSSRDDKIRELQDSLVEKDSKISQLGRQLKDISQENDFKANGSQNYPDKSETEVNEDVLVKSSAQTVTMQNGGLGDEDWEGEESNVVQEMEQLQQLIQEKDKVIRDLQVNNSSLLKMMDNKAAKGEHNVLDVHRLENEVRALKMEREQILAVMNEKSRECSNQKSEVHRLMNIISAEKVALDKLTTDNQELMQKKDSPLEDMHKEALQNLSRLVRDRDMEVEALTQKNQTLLQVLQESSGGGMEVSNLMQDKDNLSKQLATLQAEREQMVTYLNQKHQESIAYHNEIQRLTSYMNLESEKYTQIQQDFDKLKPQFEDKKQALLKIQNELINYKQKYTELEVKHGELLQRSNASETIDLSSYNSRVEEVKSLQEKNLEMIVVLKDRDSKIQSLHQQCVEWKESVACKDTEISGLHKQLDSLTFQLQGLQTELEDLNTQRSSLQQNSNEQAAELQQLKNANSQLTLVLQQREFQLKSLEEKSQTLTAIVQDQQKGTDQQEQVDRLIQENEATLTQARKLQTERDQAMMVVSQHQQSVLQLQREVVSQKEREAKTLRELERLKGHLLQVEESYTKDALEAEEREKDLRNRLAGAEESLISSSSAVENASQQATLQVESLHQQLVAAATQRDQAYLQISSLQDQCQQYSMSLANLQMVLEQFQQEKEALVATEVEHYLRENSSLQNSIAQLQKELTQTKESLTEAEDGLEAAARLMEQLDKKEEALVAIKEEVQLRETALKAAEEQISELQTVRESKVEKVVIKNLFLGYFTTPKGQQYQVLKAIGGVLSFTPTDYEKINSLNKGWMPGFLRFSGASSPSPISSPVNTPQRLNLSTTRADKSFSELFVKFLEKESSPPPPSLRLPAEEMVLDVQRHKDKAAYNPFTAPRHVAMPGQTGTSTASHDSHILMSSAPMSPTLAVFTPVTTHSTPINTSSEILKDVLSSR